MPHASANGIELFYDTFGSADDPPVLLIMGLATQMISWRESFCQTVADAGYFVIRFDNRDVGLSTSFDSHEVDPLHAFSAVLSGGTYEAPYTLDDLAADSVGLLDHLGIDAAHIVGASMGGMVAQLIAIDHPERVVSLTSLMSTTGDLSVGMPTPEVVGLMATAAAQTREEAVGQIVAYWRTINAGFHWDEDRARAETEAAVARSWNPDGAARQLVAVLVSGDRTQRLGSITAPTLVVHGTADPQIDVSGGKATASAIPGADLYLIEGMGHDLPDSVWPDLLPRLLGHLAGAAKS